MKNKILDIVIDVINSMNKNLDDPIPIDKGSACPLFGLSGHIDSLSLVSLIVAIEERIENEFGVGIILADEKAMSQKNSPFATVGSLVGYIESLLDKGVTYV